MPSTWGVKPNLFAKEYQRYLGLENMGNTCYINSIMQQLFMIPTFRYNILSLEKWKHDEKIHLDKNI